MDKHTNIDTLETAQAEERVDTSKPEQVSEEQPRKNITKVIIGFFVFCIAIVAGYYVYNNSNIFTAKKQATSELVDAEKNIDQDTLFEGKRVLYVNSYHKGLTWSDGIEKGIMSVLDKTGVTYESFEMDTKRNSDENFKLQVAQKVKAYIDTFDPDVVIASDDNAFKYVIAEYYKDAQLPFVFCGVNWDVGVYGGPYINTAGMEEVVLLDKSVNEVLPYANGESIGYLTEDTLSEHSNADNIVDYVGLELSEIQYVSSLEEWKTAYVDMQQRVDVVIIGVMESYLDRQDQSQMEELVDFVMNNTTVPTVTEHSWMVEFALLAYGKIAEEQGEWSANAALEILGGKSPSDVGVVKNQKGDLTINLALADELGIQFRHDLIKNATKVFE